MPSRTLRLLHLVCGVTALCAVPPCLAAQTAGTLPADMQAKIATAVNAILQEAQAPSAEIGIVRGGEVVYTAAFGNAQLLPAVPATTAMPYGIGSVSKQFTAAAAMVLVEQGKLRLDDPVATWFPELAHAHDITLRNLLNQVSGYEDYYTEDYLTLPLSKPVDPYQFAKEWTSHPLNFAPGTRWQYSNTNYLVASLIVQKVAGEPFFQFLQHAVLQPAGLAHVVDLDGPDVPAVPKAYLHFAFGPPRETPREAKGTLAGAGQLAMPIGELMHWDTVVMHRSAVLKPASWQVLQAEVNLPDGKGTGYGMGYFLEAHDTRRVIEHSGGLNGFTTLNQIYPDDDTAIAVLINSDTATRRIVAALEEVLFKPSAADKPAGNATGEALLRAALDQLQRGTIDRTSLTPNLDFYFTPQALADYKQSLAGFGLVQSEELVYSAERGGMQGLLYRVTGVSGRMLQAFLYVTKSGKLDQLQLMKIVAPTQ